MGLSRIAGWVFGLAVLAPGGALAGPGPRLDLGGDTAGLAPERALDPADPAWPRAPLSPLLLHRSPGLFATESGDDGQRPVASARALRLSDGGLAVRLEWSDASADEAELPPRFGDLGPDWLYKRHTARPQAFEDRACVMWPSRPGPSGRTPSLMMGEAAAPVELACWTAGRGPSALRAAGRQTIHERGPAPRGAARRSPDGWSLILLLPGLPAGTPLAFAFWDGARAQRDGVKYFSLWVELGPGVGP